MARFVLPLIIIAILLLIYIFLWRRFSPEKAFTKIIGDIHDDGVERILREIEKRPNKTAQDHYILATLYRHNPAAKMQSQNVQYNYRKMAENIARNPAPPTQNEIFQPQIALQYATDYFGTLGEEQRMLWEILQQAQSRLQNADEINAKTNKDKLGAVGGTQKYFDDKVAWTNDPQNVHDSGINSDMKAKFEMLQAANVDVDIQKFRDEAQAAIHSLPQEQRQKAALTWDSITRYGSSTPMTSIGAPEIELWAHVWKRGDSNPEVRNATLAAMADCSENGHVVCTTGRAARAISALTLLDSNPILATPAKTFEMIRNEVFEKSASLFKESLGARSEDFIASYNAGNAPEAEAEAFENGVKEKIAHHTSETYRDLLPLDQIEKIIVEAQAGV